MGLVLASMLFAATVTPKFDAAYFSQKAEYQNTKLRIDFPFVPKVVFSYSSLYSPEDDTVYLSKFFRKDAERHFLHERGHAYIDKISEKMNRGSFPSQRSVKIGEFSGTAPLTDGEILISEGIGTFFEFETIGPDHTVPEIYKLGYRTVKPAMDIDIEKATEYFLTHMPTKKDLKFREAYMRKAEEEVRKMVDHK